MRGTTLQHVLTCVLILKVTLNVILVYRDYLPPNFKSDFLQGRQAYFSGGYQWAFYSHVRSAPCSLVMGMVLLSEQFRRKHLVWHRCLGRIQVACVLLLVTPSGLWMARYARPESSQVPALPHWRSRRDCVWHVAGDLPSTGKLGTIVAGCGRCFLLLCSDVVLRLMSGLGTVAETEAQWLSPVSA